MALSEYIAGLRRRIGNDLLLLPAVAAIAFDEAGRVLLARHVDDGLWGFIGGSVEPGETPQQAVAREVHEETGAQCAVLGIAGVYGGPALEIEYPNGDRVAHVATLFVCTITGLGSLDELELLEVAWVSVGEVAALPRHGWIDEAIADAIAWQELRQ